MRTPTTNFLSLVLELDAVYIWDAETNEKKWDRYFLLAEIEIWRR